MVALVLVLPVSFQSFHNGVISKVNGPRNSRRTIAIAKDEWTRHLNLSTMNVRKLTPEIGAEITNFNVLTATTKNIRALKAVLEESHVVFLPNQPTTMTVEQHIEFGRHFGPLQSHPNLTKAVVNQHPEIFELKASQGGVANEWHTDLTFQQQPALMSILRMVQCPETGGDTMWAMKI